MDLGSLAAEPRHLVVICGGAVSGSEAAAFCARKGILAVVLEQNPRPYGKIEDGLPRWHEKLRKKEYARIDENLQAEGVLYVPNTSLGTDVSFHEIVEDWDVSALLLANGAWRDRPLPIEGADQYVDRGLVYQNPFVYWFNHYPEKNYAGPVYEVADGAIVLGGGLASIDVVKIINLELYARALKERGVEASVVELEHRGIPAFCQKRGIDPQQLDVQGCTLYYRRRKSDMPLATTKPGTPPEKTAQIRERIMDNVMKKYLVRFEGCSMPVALLTEGGRVVGVRFRRTRIEEGRVKEIPDSDYEVRSPLVVSSIGSIPVLIDGIPSKGELYDFADWETGGFTAYDNVFGLGNVLTGKGNIKESRDNAQHISTRVVESYLGLRSEGKEEIAERVHQAGMHLAEEAAEHVLERDPVPPEKLRNVLDWVKARWQTVGYEGDYQRWIEQVTPPDLA